MISSHKYNGQVGQQILTLSGEKVEIFGRAELPTRFGDFEVVSFLLNNTPIDHVAVIRGSFENALKIPCRVHSECLTGDVFGSYRCDCRDQLELSLKGLGKSKKGVIIYMRQEGRGIGIAQKVRAYSLQDLGMDTVEANLHLGFDDDLRSYEVASAMLLLLGIRSIHLFTNNPKKVEGLEMAGLKVAKRFAIQIKANEHNHFYLNTKRKRSGHLLDPIEIISKKSRLSEAK